MVNKLVSVATLLCSLAYAEAGTTAIGTATARGDLLVDGYAVKGDATLFEGTVVETGKASAALRLEKGVEIKLSSNSRGTVHRDRLVLQEGSSEWRSTSPFLIEANALRITSSGQTPSGIVSMSTSNTVRVAALTGEFQVTDSHGLLLAGVHPGNSVSFEEPQAGEQGPTPMTLFGTLTKVDGRFFLSLPAPDLGVIYELRGANLEKLVGKQVLIKGTIDTHMPTKVPGTTHVLVVLGISEILPAGMPLLEVALIGTAIAGGAAALAVGIFDAVQVATPASR